MLKSAGHAEACFGYLDNSQLWFPWGGRIRCIFDNLRGGKHRGSATKRADEPDS